MGLFIAKPKSYVLCTKAQLLIVIYKQDMMFSSLISVPCPLFCAVLNYYTIRYIIIHKALRPMIAGFVLYYMNMNKYHYTHSYRVYRRKW